MEIRPIKIDRFALVDRLPFKQLVGYQQIDGNEIEVLSINFNQLTDGLLSATITEEALIDVTNILNHSLTVNRTIFNPEEH